jgi:hypothetical protein
MTGFLKMNAESTKTGINSPGSRSGTSRIVAQPEEQKIFCYSPIIIVPDMAKGCDPAFIGETLVTRDHGSNRADSSDRKVRRFALNSPCNVEGRTGRQKGASSRPKSLGKSGCLLRPGFSGFQGSGFSCFISFLSCCLVFGMSFGTSFGIFSGWSLS